MTQKDLSQRHYLYFEAVMQLRNVLDEVVEYVEGALSKAKMHPSRVEEVVNGIDYYLPESNFARALGKQLQEKFGGEMLITSSLHTQKKGKELYRITILLRGVPFHREDKVEYLGEPCTVIALGKEILLKESRTGKKVHVKYKQMREIKLLSPAAPDTPQ